MKGKSGRDSCELAKKVDDRHYLKKKRWVQSEKEVSDGLVRAGIKNQREARPVKRVSDKRNMKKKSATALSELAKKSVTCASLEKLSDGGDLGKSQRCAHIDKEVSDGFVRAGKKYERLARSGKKVSDVRNLKKKSATDSCDMEKSQRHAQPGTQSATSVTCEKIPRRAQPAKEVSDGLNLGKNKRLAHLEKKFSDLPERTVKKVSDRHISKKIATGAT